MPAYREEARVAATVEAALGVSEIERVVVVDDGSDDGTAAAARGAGAEVLRLEENVGKGAALNAGADAVRSSDVVLLLDADLGETASEAALLLAPVLAGDADMTIATFPPAGKAGLGLVKGLAARTIERLGGGFEATAPLSGQRALSARALDAAMPFAEGFGVELSLTVSVLRAGLTVREVSTEMAHAATGRDVAGFAHRGRQYLDVRRVARALDREARASTRD